MSNIALSSQQLLTPMMNGFPAAETEETTLAQGMPLVGGRFTKAYNITGTSDVTLFASPTFLTPELAQSATLNITFIMKVTNTTWQLGWSNTGDTDYRYAYNIQTFSNQTWHRSYTTDEIGVTDGELNFVAASGGNPNFKFINNQENTKSEFDLYGGGDYMLFDSLYLYDDNFFWELLGRVQRAGTSSLLVDLTVRCADAPA